jgi:hypothetical protein
MVEKLSPILRSLCLKVNWTSRAIYQSFPELLIEHSLAVTRSPLVLFSHLPRLVVFLDETVMANTGRDNPIAGDLDQYGWIAGLEHVQADETRMEQRCPCLMFPCVTPTEEVRHVFRRRVDLEHTGLNIHGFKCQNACFLNLSRIAPSVINT